MLEITLNGFTYVSSHVVLEIDDCKVSKCELLLLTSVLRSPSMYLHVTSQFIHTFIYVQSIAAATPNTYCSGETPAIVLSGVGFLTNLDRDHANCRFRTDGGREYCE